MTQKIFLFVMLLAFESQAHARSPFTPETTQLIDHLFGVGSSKHATAGKKTLRIKFNKESPWTFQTIRENCQKNFLACPKTTAFKQTLKQCLFNKKQCLKHRFAARKHSEDMLPRAIPMSYSYSIAPTLKILFRKKDTDKKRFHKTRLVIIHETLIPNQKTTTAKVIMDAALTDLHFISVRLPETPLKNLCKNPLNLVTVLLKGEQTLYYKSRATLIRIACD